MVLNVRAWAQHDDRGLPSDDRFMVAKGIIKMTDKTKLKMRLDHMLKWADGKRCLVILDTWARATAGYSSNTQEEMDLAYENAEKVAKALNGPMLACFHPPKDGRMTIRGSAVQEDASSGIWELEKEQDGVKLTIGRAKGKGEGNFRKFSMKPVDLPGFDIYKDRLQGLVPICFAGTESENTEDAAKTHHNKRRAWAKAIIGALVAYPAENLEAKTETSVSGLAKFLTRMWVNRGSTEYAHEQEFVATWMDTFKSLDQLSTVNNNGQWAQVQKALNTMFLDKDADHNAVVVDDKVLTVMKKGTTKSTYWFKIETKPEETGKQE
jgi:hypothetical protein